MYHVKKMTQVTDQHFMTIVDWYWDWLGKANDESYEEVLETMAHSLNHKRLPQTFLVYRKTHPVAMFQIAMADDLTIRPNFYPWLINVYVDPAYRHQGVFTFIMEQISSIASRLGLHELYCYTHHLGLYDKFGWIPIENLAFPGRNGQRVTVYKIDLQ